MAWKTKFRDNARLAVELFGIAHVAKELEVMQSTVSRWVRGQTFPPEGSPMANKLAFMLKEDA